MKMNTSGKNDLKCTLCDVRLGKRQNVHFLHNKIVIEVWNNKGVMIKREIIKNYCKGCLLLIQKQTKKIKENFRTIIE